MNQRTGIGLYLAKERAILTVSVVKCTRSVPRTVQYITPNQFNLHGTKSVAGKYDSAAAMEFRLGFNRTHAMERVSSWLFSNHWLKYLKNTVLTHQKPSCAAHSAVNAALMIFTSRLCCVLFSFLYFSTLESAFQLKTTCSTINIYANILSQ